MLLQCYKPKTTGVNKKKRAKKLVIDKGLKTHEIRFSIYNNRVFVSASPDDKNRYRATNEKSILKLEQ